jgi:hypothetical protein
MAQRQQSLAVPAPLVALAGWCIPGAGYWLLGHRLRGMVIGITILALFIGGILIGGIRVIDVPKFTAAGNIFADVLEKPWYIGQILTGPICLIASWASRAAASDPSLQQIMSHSRLNEIGTLYAAVAGMLNLLAIIDSSSRAAQEEGK